MGELLPTILFLLNRYIHIVAGTFLVGGTLFYEMVLPIAIADLRSEHQLAVIGRARWVFRRIVMWCAALLMLSGIFATARNWDAYSGDERSMFGEVIATARSVKIEGLAPWQNPRTWVIGHELLGVLGLVIAVSLVVGQRPPEKPIRWMRLGLMILLIAIFMGSATRNARLRAMEMVAGISSDMSFLRMPFFGGDSEPATSAPINAPATLPTTMRTNDLPTTRP